MTAFMTEFVDAPPPQMHHDIIRFHGSEALPVHVRQALASGGQAAGEALAEIGGAEGSTTGRVAASGPSEGRTRKRPRGSERAREVGEAVTAEGEVRARERARQRRDGTNKATAADVAAAAEEAEVEVEVDGAAKEEEEERMVLDDESDAASTPHRRGSECSEEGSGCAMAATMLAAAASRDHNGRLAARAYGCVPAPARSEDNAPPPTWEGQPPGSQSAEDWVTGIGRWQGTCTAPPAALRLRPSTQKLKLIMRDLGMEAAGRSRRDAIDAALRECGLPASLSHESVERDIDAVFRFLRIEPRLVVQHHPWGDGP